MTETQTLYSSLQKRKNLAVATFAGGCFWCMEGPFEQLEGVEEAIAGYSGGDDPQPTYDKVKYGRTGHREAVQVFYDPKQISYEQLLDTYWLQVDPTDAEGQFADRGYDYTTALFYHSPEQKKLAEKSKQALNTENRYGKPIVTEILPYKNFYLAEEDHQNFYKKQRWYYEMYKKGSGRAKFVKENKKFLKKANKS